MASLRTTWKHDHCTGAAFFVVAEVISLSAGLVLQAVAARQLSPTDFGRFAVAHTILLFSSHLLCGVVPRACARQVSVLPNCLPATWRTLLWVHLPVCAAFSLLLYGARYMLGGVLSDLGMISLIWPMALLVFLHCGMLEPCWSLLNGLRYHGLQSVLLVLHAMLRCVAVYIALIVQPNAISVVGGLLVATTCSIWLVFPSVLAAVRRSTGRQQQPGLDRHDIWRWVKLSALVDCVFYLAVASNLWTVKARVAEEQIIATYAASFVLAQANLPLCRAVSRGFFAYFAAAAGRGELPECRRLLRSLGRLLLIGLSLELAVTASIGQQFVEWFSGMTLSDLTVPWLLNGGAALLGASFVICELLAAANYLRVRAAAAMFYGTVAISGALLFITYDGARTGAVVFGASGVLTLVLLSVACHRIFGPWELKWNVLRCGIAALLSAAAGRALPAGAGLLWLAGTSLTIVLTYTALLLLFGEFPDRKAQILHRLAMRCFGFGSSPRTNHSA